MKVPHIPFDTSMRRIKELESLLSQLSSRRDSNAFASPSTLSVKQLAALGLPFTNQHMVEATPQGLRPVSQRRAPSSFIAASASLTASPQLLPNSARGPRVDAMSSASGQAHTVHGMLAPPATQQQQQQQQQGDEHEDGKEKRGAQRDGSVFAQKRDGIDGRSFLSAAAVDVHRQRLRGRSNSLPTLLEPLSMHRLLTDIHRRQAAIAAVAQGGDAGSGGGVSGRHHRGIRRAISASCIDTRVFSKWEEADLRRLHAHRQSQDARTQTARAPSATVTPATASAAAAAAAQRARKSQAVPAGKTAAADNANATAATAG